MNPEEKKAAVKDLLRITRAARHAADPLLELKIDEQNLAAAKERLLDLSGIEVMELIIAERRIFGGLLIF